MSHGSKDKPRWRSKNGCCICETKSSSSRFTNSERYSDHFEGCFGPRAANRAGDLCNACVLCVKRWLKNESEPGAFAKVLGSKKGAGPKHQKEIEKRKRKREKEAAKGLKSGTSASSLSSSNSMAPYKNNANSYSNGNNGLHTASHHSAHFFGAVDNGNDSSLVSVGSVHLASCSGAAQGQQDSSKSSGASVTASQQQSNSQCSLGVGGASGQASVGCSVAVLGELHPEEECSFNKPLQVATRSRKANYNQGCSSTAHLPLNTSTPCKNTGVSVSSAAAGVRPRSRAPLSGNGKHASDQELNPSYVTRAVSAANHQSGNKRYSTITRKRKQPVSDDEDEFDCSSSTFSDLHRSVSSASLQRRCPTCSGAILDDGGRASRSSKRHKTEQYGAALGNGSQERQASCPRHFKERSSSQDSTESPMSESSFGSSQASSGLAEKRKYNRRVRLPPIKLEDSPVTNEIYNHIMEQKGRNLDEELTAHMKIYRTLRRRQYTNQSNHSTANTATANGTMNGNSDSLSSSVVGAEVASWRSSSPIGGQNGQMGRNLTANSGNTTLANTSGYGSECGYAMDTSLFDDASGSILGHPDMPSTASSFPGDNIKVCQCKCTCGVSAGSNGPSYKANGQEAVFAKPERRRGGSIGTRAASQNGASFVKAEQSF